MENYEINHNDKFDYNFVFEDKYIYVNLGNSESSRLNALDVNKNNQKYKITSPYLKVLKAKHEFKNKNYLIVQLDQDLDVDEKVEHFIKKIRYIDEYSKEVLVNNSKNWYGKKWDIYTLDSMTRYPIDEQKGLFYMKIIIDKEDKDLNQRIQTLEKIVENSQEVYICVETYFKGLRWSREVFTEEWYLDDFKILEEEKDEIEELLENIILKKDSKKKEEIENIQNKKVEEISKFEVQQIENIQKEELQNLEVEGIQNLEVEEIQNLEVEEILNFENEEIENIEVKEIFNLENEVEQNLKIEEIQNKNIKKNKKDKFDSNQSVSSSSSKKIKKIFTLHGKIIK
jgi:hypothetical protein